MLSPLSYVLWLVQPVFQAAIGYRMLTRQLYRDYFLFFAYTIEQLARFIVLFCTFHLRKPLLYRNAYFAFEMVEAVLQLSVICEIFAHLFRTYEGIRRFAWVLLRWAAIVLVIIGLVVAVFNGGSDTDKMAAGFFTLGRSLEIVQGGLLFLLFVLASGLGLKWEQPGFGIALGFGIYTSINLVTFTLRMELGGGADRILSQVSNAGFDCAVLVWLITMYSRRPAHRFEQQVPGWDVEAWNRALLDLLRRAVAVGRLS